MNSRRIFIKNTGFFVAAMAVAPSFACTPVAKKTIGLQLYSLRDIIKNDIKGIIAKVAAIGYNEVETYGYSVKDGFWGLKPKEFKNLLKQHNITSPSGHFDITNFLTGKSSDTLKSCIEAANILGSTYITVPWLGSELVKTADDYKIIAQKLNEAGAICKTSGLKIGYHNHNFEFKKIGDTTGYEILLSETEKNLVDFELDLYWAVKSGVDPLDLFQAHPQRFTMWHVKDMDNANKEFNTEIGNGSIDFKAIFKSAKNAGVKHFFVEHETNYKPNEMDSVKTSFNYVNNQLL